MQFSIVLNPMATSFAAGTSLLMLLLTCQGPAWGDDLNPTKTDQDWVRVEDLEEADSLNTGPATETSLQEGDAPPDASDSPEPTVRAPRSSAPKEKVPQNWQFKTRSLDQNPPAPQADLEETFTF